MRLLKTEVLDTGEAEDVESEEEPHLDCSGHGTDKVSRTYRVSSEEKKRYYLRTLLLPVPEAKCCEDIRPVDSEVCETFRDACSKRGLLAKDELNVCHNFGNFLSFRSVHATD